MNKSEYVFNYLYVWPYLKSTNSALCNSQETSQAEFEIDEVSLKAMATQLNSVGLYRDDTGQYKADDMISIYSIDRLEILHHETSSYFECSDRSKISFDHHEGLFRALSILKTIADTFFYALVELFGDLKVFYTQAAGTYM